MIRCHCYFSCSYILWVWSFGDTQTCQSALHFLGPWGCQKSKSGGNLELFKELQFGFQLKQNEVSVKRLCAVGQKEVEPITYSILFYCILFYSNVFYSILIYSILIYSNLVYSNIFYSILIYSVLFKSILFYSILIYSILTYSILIYSILF